MQIITPAANDPQVPVTTPNGDTELLTPAQRQDKLIESVLSCTEHYVGQPCPYPLEAEQTASSRLAYTFYDINPLAYPCLEQSEELQLRLEGDILPTAAQCNPLTLASCDALLQGLETQKSLAQGMLTTKLKLIKALQEMARSLFRQHTQDGQLGGFPVPLSPAILDAFQSFEIDTDEWASPAQAYAGICRIWAEMERSVAQETLQVLSLTLQVLRLGLYRSAGQYLSDQANTLLSQHLEDEDWVELGQVHRGGILLKNCAEDPFLSRWPNGLGLRRPSAAALT